jgi:hypothetical protein
MIGKMGRTRKTCPPSALRLCLSIGTEMVFLQFMTMLSDVAAQTCRHYNGWETSAGLDRSTLSDMENWTWGQRLLRRWSG